MPYQSQSDGMVERFNNTLIKMLSASVDKHHTNWNQFLPYVMMGYKTAEDETTGFNPNRVMMEREVATATWYKVRTPKGSEVHSG